MIREIRPIRGAMYSLLLGFLAVKKEYQPQRSDSTELAEVKVAKKRLAQNCQAWEKEIDDRVAGLKQVAMREEVAFSPSPGSAGVLARIGNTSIIARVWGVGGDGEECGRGRPRSRVRQTGRLVPM